MQPEEFTSSKGLSMIFFPVCNVSRSAQLPWQISPLRISWHLKPKASLEEKPVISDIALLKKVIRQSASTVKTPQLMVFKIIS
jgi:hypothetical protein